MRGADLQAMLPQIMLGGLLVLLLVVVAFWRHPRGSLLLTLLVLAAALAAVPAALAVAPRLVTPLLAVDGFSLYCTVLILIAAGVVVLLSAPGLAARQDDREEYYLLLLAATLGAVTLTGARHFASLLLGLEILSISLFVLIAYPRRGHAPLEAALKYLILSGGATTTLLLGAALIYAATGSLEFLPASPAAAGAPAVAPAAAPAGALYLTAGTAMVLAGVAFKLSLVPFHMWTPDVYQGAPAPVAAYLATVAKGAVAAVLLRYLLQTGALETPATAAALALLAMVSMVAGNLLALRQQHVKRVLAYSAIAHLGYLLLPVVALGAMNPVLAAETVLVYLAAYFTMTLAAFGVVSVLSDPAGEGEADHLDAYEGLFWRRPLLALVLTLALLSLAGIPLTLGFIAKFYVFAAGVSATRWLLVAALVVGSGIALYYYLRIIFAMSRVPDAAAVAAVAAADRGAAQRGEAAGRWLLGALGVLLLVFGIYPEPLIAAVRDALQGWGG